MPRYSKPFKTEKRTRQLPTELWNEVDKIIKEMKKQWLKNREC